MRIAMRPYGSRNEIGYDVRRGPHPQQMVAGRFCNEALMAALCRQHALSLMTRDRHFDLIKGFERVDW